ncbi:hypothetical protein [Streptomyces sp. NBC_01022]|uniref:hypothetical protein n=1 Tax=Streptomyces sp. NBC_01022 TaxID=2903723 RepID=UPI002DDA379A|nr:hypothetical protein [Streptomyces sp. NBC_01022]WRZ83308.1 hypothetical protein OG316_25190 [Streptomyces sp. NBC_01022]
MPRMTDWSRLSHAYGSAEDIPALLDRIASDPASEHWSDLWSALCHQGSVYSASFAALPWLADVAGTDDREQAVSALTLAGAIMAGAGQSHGAGDVRVTYAAEVAALLSLANERLRTAADRSEYAYLLEAVLSFEGVFGWSEELAWGLTNEEYEVSCPGPGCAAAVFIVVGEYGFFSAVGDYATLPDDQVRTKPLRPAEPAALTGIGRRLHDVALADGQQEVARTLTHIFGDATCPDCAEDFSVAARISADWTATSGG